MRCLVPILVALTLGCEPPPENKLAVDNDGDGFTEFDGDCDDDDPDLGLRSEDADCDGILTAEDCDDGDETLLRVGDCDGDGTVTAEDCDDSDDGLGSMDDDGDCDGVLDCLPNMEGLGGEVVADRGYLLVTETMSWGDADAACRTLGYDGLAVILDPDEQSAIERIAMETSGQVWIGSLKRGDGSWRWRDLTPVDSGPTYWRDGFNNEGSGNRGMVSPDGGWGSAEAFEPKEHICECREDPITSEY